MVIIIALVTFVVGLVLGAAITTVWLSAPYHMERVRNSIFAVKTTLSEEELRKYIL